MLCTSRSENRLAVVLRSEGLGKFPVGSEGVWHKLQPTKLEVNNVRPRLILRLVTVLKLLQVLRIVQVCNKLRGLSPPKKRSL